MNSYFQYFGGAIHQQWGQPCAASDMVYCRQRIGEEKILKHSIDVYGKDGKD